MKLKRIATLLTLPLLCSIASAQTGEGGDEGRFGFTSSNNMPPLFIHDIEPTSRPPRVIEPSMTRSISTYQGEKNSSGSDNGGKVALFILLLLMVAGASARRRS